MQHTRTGLSQLCLQSLLSSGTSESSSAQLSLSTAHLAQGCYPLPSQGRKGIGIIIVSGLICSLNSLSGPAILGTPCGLGKALPLLKDLWRQSSFLLLAKEKSQTLCLPANSLPEIIDYVNKSRSESGELSHLNERPQHVIKTRNYPCKTQHNILLISHSLGF